MGSNNFAGRAGKKLEFALERFNLDVTNKICADFGSAVGGFVDCLLKHKAKKVYAIEKGYGVLAWNLRSNPRVEVMERTNAMHVRLPEKVDVITIDTSWTRQRNIVPNALKNLKKNGMILTLIKPHYEADRKLLESGRLSENDAKRTARKVLEEIESFPDVIAKGLIKSPIVGGKASNVEYLAYLQRSN